MKTGDDVFMWRRLQETRSSDGSIPYDSNTPDILSRYIDRHFLNIHESTTDQNLSSLFVCLRYVVAAAAFITFLRLSYGCQFFVLSCI